MTIVKRKIYAVVPPKVEYDLTDFCKTPIPMLEEIAKWGRGPKENWWTKTEVNRVNEVSRLKSLINAFGQLSEGKSGTPLDVKSFDQEINISQDQLAKTIRNETVND